MFGEALSAQLFLLMDLINASVTAIVGAEFPSFESSNLSRHVIVSGDGGSACRIKSMAHLSVTGLFFIQISRSISLITHWA